MKTGLIHGRPEPCTVSGGMGDDEDRVIVITGLPRGGTSAVAAIVRAMGVSFGNKDLTATFEEARIDTAMRDGGWAAMKQAIADVKDSPVFAIKKPDVWRLIHPHDMSEVSSLVLVVVYRDAVAVTHRYAKDSDVEPAISRVLSDYRVLSMWAKAVTARVKAYVSYERVLGSPLDAARQLSSVCGVKRYCQELVESAVTSGGYLLEPIRGCDGTE